jgi:hypothetical protein
LQSNYELESDYLEAKAKIANLERELRLAEDNFSVVWNINNFESYPLFAHSLRFHRNTDIVKKIFRQPESK